MLVAVGMRKRVIHWFRRDLRVTDNIALYSASREAAEIVPAYILSTWKGHHHWTGPNRQRFLCGCLASVANNLEHLGGRLILRSGPPAEELVKLALESGAQTIYFNQNYGPYDVQIEQHIRQRARGAGIEVRAFKDTLILAPEEALRLPIQVHRQNQQANL